MNRQRNIAVILFIVIFAVVSVSIAYFYPRVFESTNVFVPINKELMDLPKIESSVVSSSDGTAHNFSVKFTLAVDEKAKKDIDKKSLNAQLQDIVSTLDYDKITAVGNMDYIKSEVLKGIDSYVSQDDLKGIYIRDINSGSYKFPDPDNIPASTGSKRINDIFKGLRTR